MSEEVNTQTEVVASCDTNTNRGLCKNIQAGYFSMVISSVEPVRGSMHARSIEEDDPSALSYSYLYVG